MSQVSNGLQETSSTFCAGLQGQLFSLVNGAMLIYIMERSAPMCGTSLEGEIDCMSSGFAKDLFFTTVFFSIWLHSAGLEFGPSGQFFGITQAMHIATQEMLCSTKMTGPVQGLQ